MINEKTNWNWQISQFSQRIGEWLEYQMSKWQLPLPKWSSPQWSQISWLKTLLEVLLWLLVGLFAFWMARELWRQFSPYWYSWLAKTGNTTEVQKNTELSATHLWERSQDFYRQNNYAEACRYLYLAMLQRLHDQQIVPHKSSRTDGEYLQLVQLESKLSQPYETLITTHEQLCFGDKSISQINYEQCQQAYQEISQS
jgi:Domain of unknown function (DUF4129)